ncbi:MAG: patatin-like phospholipase family protein [Candidatus Omnitrophica bacterium]|nr:patatin-like phospholipase family protein [Candidatus Omnitrophota bacterium]
MAESDFIKVLRRFKKNLKIGLALSSGSARGEAHVGVIKAIIDKGIPVNMIAGASAGAIVGACFAATGNVDDIEKAIYEARPKQLREMISLDLAIRLKGFIGEEKSLKWLKSLIGGVYFRDLKIPLAIVATDMQSGDQVVITEGSVLEAVRASIAMPVLFTPTKSQGRFLVDGGFSNPLPVDVLKNMGATFVIASNVIRTPEQAKTEFLKEGSMERNGMSNIILSDKLEKAREELIKSFAQPSEKTPAVDAEEIPNMFNVLISSVYTMEYAFVRSKIRQADITISPDIRNLNMLDFFRGREVIAKGQEAASKKLSKLVNRLSR